MLLFIITFNKGEIYLIDNSHDSVNTGLGKHTILFNLLFIPFMCIYVEYYFCSHCECISVLTVLLTSSILTYQAWTSTSASETSSPGPSAAAQWRWCGYGVASSGGECSALCLTRCWCWEVSGWVKARSLWDAVERAGAGVRGPRPERMVGVGGGACWEAAAWSLRGAGRHVVMRSLEEQRQCVSWQKHIEMQ